MLHPWSIQYMWRDTWKFTPPSMPPHQHRSTPNHRGSPTPKIQAPPGVLCDPLRLIPMPGVLLLHSKGEDSALLLHHPHIPQYGMNPGTLTYCLHNKLEAPSQWCPHCCLLPLDCLRKWSQLTLLLGYLLLGIFIFKLSLPKRTLSN